MRLKQLVPLMFLPFATACRDGTVPAEQKPLEFPSHKTISVSSQPSQAVVLLVGAENLNDDDTPTDFSHRNADCREMTKNIRSLQSVFESQNVPCHVIGSPENGYTVQQLQKNLARLINKNGYNAITVFIFRHGGLHNLTDAESCTDEAIEQKLKDDDCYHIIQTSFGAGDQEPQTIPVRELFSALKPDSLMAAGSRQGFNKIDVVLATCTGGAVKQSEVDLLPKGSTVFVPSGANDDVRTVTAFSLTHILKKKKLVEGFDALDFARLLLYNSGQFTEKDAIICVSQASSKISLKNLATDFFQEKKPASYIDAHEEFVKNKMLFYSDSVMLKSFESFKENERDVKYPDYFSDHQSIMQAIVLDRTITFQNEPK